MSTQADAMARGEVGVESVGFAAILPPPFPRGTELEAWMPDSRSLAMGTIEFALERDPQATLEVRRVNYIEFDGVRGTYDVSSPEGLETQTSRIPDASRLTIRCESDCFVLASGSGAWTSAPRAAATSLPTPRETARAIEVPTGAIYRRDGEPGVAFVAIESGATQANWSGPAEIVVWGAEASLETPEGNRSYFAGARTSREGAARETEWTVLVFRVGAGELKHAPSAGGLLLARAPSYFVAGTVDLRGSGIVAYRDESWSFSEGLARITGTMEVVPTCKAKALGPANCAYRIQGDFGSVKLNGEEIGKRDLARRALLGGTLATLFAWATRAIVPLYYRLGPDNALKHPQRQRIVRIIEENPGIHFSELMRRTGVASGSLAHHLRVLRDFEIVRTTETAGFRVYWPADGAATGTHPLAKVVLTRDRARSLAERIVDSPGVTQRELSETLGFRQANVSYHLLRLVNAGLLVVKRDGPAGRLKHYYPSEALRKALAHP